MRRSPICMLSSAFLLATMTVLVVLFGQTSLALAQGSSFLGQHHTIKTIASTVPDNGDINPYGVAVVPTSVGHLSKGNVLVSNFNASSNLQGTGTTIVQISPAGQASLFAHLDAATLPGACPGGVGLTTALVVLNQGWVIVGSLPSKDGTAAQARAGCLIVLNSDGKAVETFAGGAINGPWDMTAVQYGDWAALFVTNVLNGTVAASPNIVKKGTVVRIDLKVPGQGYGYPQRTSTTVIGSGFSERTDPNALVIGPTGVAVNRAGTLYVTDSLNNRIAAIPYALTRKNTAFTGKTVTANGTLNDPLGLTIAPDGNIITANGNDGNLVETTPAGTQVASQLVDNTGGTGGGCLFGLAFLHGGSALSFVDDCDNTLKTLS